MNRHGAFDALLLSSRPTLHGTWLFVLVASSFAVQIEPAPVDLLAAGLIGWALITGLPIPGRLGLPMFFVALFMLAHVTSAANGVIATDAAVPHMALYTAQTVYLFASMVLFAAVVSHDHRSALRTIWAGYSVAAVLAVTIAVLAYFSLLPNNENYLQLGRARAVFKDPNVFSPFLVPVALYALTLALGARDTLRATLAVGLFGYLMVGIVLAFSRGGVLNLLAAAGTAGALALVTGASARNWKTALPRIAALAVVGTLALGAFAATPQVRDMLKVRMSLVQKYDTDRGGRFRAQTESLKSGFANPLGDGPQIRPSSAAFADPHNVYIKVLSEYGMLGALSFYAFCAATVLLGLRDCFAPSSVRPMLILAYACVVGNLVESLFVDTLHWRHLFLVLGMQWGLMAVVRRERERSSEPLPHRSFAT